MYIAYRDTAGNTLVLAAYEIKEIEIVDFGYGNAAESEDNWLHFNAMFDSQLWPMHVPIPMLISGPVKLTAL